MDWDLQMEAMSSYVVESAKNITVAISEAIPDDIHQHLELTRNAYESTITAIRLWGLVFLPVFNFLYWLVVSVWNVVLPILPPIWEALKSAAAYIWQLFLIHVWPSIHIRLMHMKRKLSQADPPTVAFTIATMFILVMVLSKIRSFIRAGYLKRLRVYAVQKARDMNRMVKKMLSGLGASTFHVCIFAHALLTVFHYLPEAATEPLSHPALFWLVTLCYPAYATLCAVHQYRVADPRPSTLNNLNRWLTYWTVIVALGVVLQLPLVLALLSKVKVVYTLRNHFVFWLWFPYTNGASIMFGILVPFINRFVRKLPDTTVSDDKKGIIASLFHAVFPASVRWMVDWVLQVGPVLVVSLPFFLTPGIITSYGAIFVGQVYPCYMSVTTLIQNGAVRSNVKGKKKAKQLAGKPSKKVPMPRGHENDATRPEARHDVHWLTYWCTYSPLRMGLHVLMVYLPSVPGWYHIELGMVIWLMMKGSGVLVNELDLLLFRRNWKKLDNIQRQKGMMEVGEEPAVKLTETEIKDESTTISATKTIVASPAIKREGRHKEPELDAQTTEQTQLPLRSNTDISTDGPPSSSSNVRKRVGKTPSTGKLNL